MTDVLKAALDEIDEYCEYNKWLNEINIYCKKWTDKSVKELRGEAAFTIEVCKSFIWFGYSLKSQPTIFQSSLDISTAFLLLPSTFGA